MSLLDLYNRQFGKLLQEEKALIIARKNANISSLPDYVGETWVVSRPAQVYTHILQENRGLRDGFYQGSEFYHYQSTYDFTKYGRRFR